MQFISTKYSMKTAQKSKAFRERGRQRESERQQKKTRHF